jgi:hypothetical protein
VVAPWGIELTGVRVPVRLWSGAQDTDTPPAHARWLASVIAGASLRQFPDEGTCRSSMGATARWSTGSPSTCIGAGDRAAGRCLATEVAATEDNAVSPEPLGDRVQRPYVRCRPLGETRSGRGRVLSPMRAMRGR